MAHTSLATNQTPALIIYLLDASASMAKPMGEKRRIDVIMSALAATLRHMVFRSTKGGRLSPRYRIAMYAYSDRVYDLMGGVQQLDQVAQLGVAPAGRIARLTAVPGAVGLPHDRRRIHRR